MAAAATGPKNHIFVTRTAFKYMVVPGAHITAPGNDIRFRNLTGEDLEVVLPGVFEPNRFSLAPNASGVSTMVDPNAPAGAYEYEVKDGRGFFAEGNSSPRIIVDP